MPSKKTLFRLLIGGCIAAAVLLLYVGNRGHAEESAAASAPRSAASGAFPFPVAAGTASAASGAASLSAQQLEQLDQAYRRLAPADQQAVQRTAAYLQFVQQMQALQQSPPPQYTPQQAAALYSEIDFFQQNRYFSLYQGYQMKAAVARSTYSGAALDNELDTLKTAFTQQYQALQQQSDPRNDPVRNAFVQAQQQMITQANRMTAFPDGLSKEQYIIRESERIRAQYYRD